MILLSYVGKVDVADLIAVVKVYKEAAIADRYISHLVCRKSLLDGRIEFLLDRRAESDDFGDDLAGSIDNEGLRDIAPLEKYHVREHIVRKSDRVIDLCRFDEFRYLWDVLFAAYIETYDLKVLAAVFGQQGIQVWNLSPARFSTTS